MTTVVAATHQMRHKFYRSKRNGELTKQTKQGRLNRDIMAAIWKSRRAIPGYRLQHRTYMASFGWSPRWIKPPRRIGKKPL